MAKANETPSAYLPGPWFVRFDDDHEFASSARVVDEADATIAVVQHQHLDPDDMLPANANLIASAPDLFELTLAYRQECSDQLAQYWDDLKQDFGDPDDLQEMVDYWATRMEQCDAAIAKAKGEAA